MFGQAVSWCLFSLFAFGLSVCPQSGRLDFGVFFSSAICHSGSVNSSRTCQAHGLLLWIITFIMLIYVCNVFKNYEKVEGVVLECQRFEFRE